jgi:OTU domain-containing protein 3
MIKSVTTSLPFLANDETIRKALYDNNGNVDAAVSQLLDEPSSTPSTPGSYSSQSGSSSVERDADSDDEEEVWGPNKRKNRKIRALKRKEKEKEVKLDAKEINAQLPLPDMTGMAVLYI